MHAAHEPPRRYIPDRRPRLGPFEWSLASGRDSQCRRTGRRQSEFRNRSPYATESERRPSADHFPVWPLTIRLPSKRMFFCLGTPLGTPQTGLARLRRTAPHAQISRRVYPSAFSPQRPSLPAVFSGFSGSVPPRGALRRARGTQRGPKGEGHVQTPRTCPCSGKARLFNLETARSTAPIPR